MLRIIKHLWLGTTLVIAASCLLLFSDLGNRKAASHAHAQKLTRIAIMQMGSASTMDDSVQGLKEELTAQGYIDGKTAQIRCFNASGEHTIAATIARDIVADNYDIVFTSGTPTLQTFANANRDGRKTHVFFTVTDPSGSGVGITGPEPSQHPAHMVGIGTFQPVENAFDIAVAKGITRGRPGHVAFGEHGERSRC